MKIRFPHINDLATVVKLLYWCLIVEGKIPHPNFDKLVNNSLTQLSFNKPQVYNFLL